MLTGIMKQYTHPINMGILVFPFLRDFRDPIVINPPLSCKWQQHYDDTWKSWCVLPLPHHASKNLPTYTYGSHLTAGQMTAVLLLSTWVECMWLFDEQWVKVKMTIVCLILWSTSATLLMWFTTAQYTHTSKNMIHYIFVPLNHCMATELEIVCISEHSTELQSSSPPGHKQLLHLVSSSNFNPIQLSAWYANIHM